jgi:hypothetical protein
MNLSYSDDEADGCVFPFHDECYEILTATIMGASGRKSSGSVDRKVLFRTLRHFVGDAAKNFEH